jgi:CDP-glycerol glycerophosphotransferase (TagB/SpsB family)
VILQSPDSLDTERIPDFLLDFLRRENPQVIVNFRTHPNDRDGFDYAKNRLQGKFATKFYITSQKIDLYNELQRSTHLISRYSSVCLEASFFALPVLTYGENPLSVFSNQIQSGELAWTLGNTDDIENFVNNLGFVQKEPAPYITSSVQFAQSVAVSLIEKKLSKEQLS